MQHQSTPCTEEGEAEEEGVAGVVGEERAEVDPRTKCHSLHRTFCDVSITVISIALVNVQPYLISGQKFMLWSS